MCRMIVSLTILVLPWLPLQAQKLSPAHVHYRIAVARRAEHILHVSVSLDPGHEQARFRLPTWYALYQIRNFSQFLRSPRAIAVDGSELPFAVNR